jgi:hypothetical protein
VRDKTSRLSLSAGGIRRIQMGPLGASAQFEELGCWKVCKSDDVKQALRCRWHHLAPNGKQCADDRVQEKYPSTTAPVLA